MERKGREIGGVVVGKRGKREAAKGGKRRQGWIMVPAGPEAWKRLPASRKTFTILILL